MRITTLHSVAELTSFPGCAQIAVSHNAFTLPKYRGQGKGLGSHISRLRIAKDMGYDYMLCTVKADNIAQIKILKNAQWTKLAAFESSYTTNVVELWGKSLTR